MKEIQLPVSELKTALAGFNKVVSSKSVLPVLGCLRVQPVPEGVDLQVTDSDSFATCRIKASTPPDFPPCLVSLATLAKVAKTSQDRISLIYEGDQRMKLRQFIGTHPVEQPIDCLPIEDWPAVPQIKAEPFQVDPGFKEAFRHAMECSSADSTRAILNGACLDVTQADCHCLVATDGRHLFSANTFHFSLSQSAVIPNRKFLNWSGFAEDGQWSLAVEPPVLKGQEVVTPGYVQMQSEHWTFLTKGIDGSYPNWRQVMPSPERKFTKVTVSELAVGAILDALPRMPGSDESDQSVTLVVQDGNLLLRSRPRFTDHWAEIPVPDVSVAGSDTQICLNRGFIIKALRFGFTEFEVQDALSPILFTAPGRKMVAMPMRFNDAAATPHADSQPSPQSPQEAATPPETAPAAPRPPREEPSITTEQNPAMATNNITALPAPERGNLKPTTTNGNNGESPTAMKAAVESVERIKTNLRDVIGNLNDTLDLLKAAEKEKKATLKEVESVRATLRSLQKVEL